jgi:hypothetical protein
MRKIFTLMAVVALAACDSATGADRAARETPGRGEARAPEVAHHSGGAAHRAVIVSVRRKVNGTPGLYEARALAVDGGEVTLEVRSNTVPFLNLSSGTFESEDVGTGEANLQWQTASGKRYLVIAYPSSGGGATRDATHAHYLEPVP